MKARMTAQVPDNAESCLAPVPQRSKAEKRTGQLSFRVQLNSSATVKDAPSRGAQACKSMLACCAASLPIRYRRMYDTRCLADGPRENVTMGRNKEHVCDVYI
jgi:hypothetical protein